jgi:Domain of unknown function (DUF4350)
MPPKLSRSDRKLLLGAGVVFILLVAGAVLFSSGQGSKAEIPTTYSTASGGARAAYLLLRESGYTVAHWEKPLSELPQPSGQVLVIADPERAPTVKDRQQLAKFISDGGHVIATGLLAAYFLPKASSDIDFINGMAWKKSSAVAPSAITRAAPEIVLAPEAYWQSTRNATGLYEQDKHLRVVKYSYGKGEVIWWASATPLTNAGLREPGNLDFFLACLGDGHPPVWWDEYAHGYRETTNGPVVHSPALWIFLQVGLVSLAALATFSRRNGPIFPLVVENRLSPLEFVYTLGGLYKHAKASSVAVDISYQRFRYWLTRRLGMANNASLADLRTGLSDRWRFTDGEGLISTLAECESARYNPSLPSAEALRLVQALDDYAAQLKLFHVASKEKA